MLDNTGSLFIWQLPFVTFCPYCTTHGLLCQEDKINISRLARRNKQYLSDIIRTPQNNITGLRCATHCWKQRVWINIQSTIFRWNITIVLRSINVFKAVLPCTTHISTVTSFGPLYRLSSGLHTRAHESNYTTIYISSEKEISSFTQLYKTGEKCIWFVSTIYNKISYKYIYMKNYTLKQEYN